MNRALVCQIEKYFADNLAVFICQILDTRFSLFCDGMDWEDSHQHHISEPPVFAGCGVRAGITNETNTYWQT